MKIEQADIDKIDKFNNGGAITLKQILMNKMESINKLKPIKADKGLYLGELNNNNNNKHGIGKLVHHDLSTYWLGKWDNDDFIFGYYEVLVDREESVLFKDNNNMTTKSGNKKDLSFVSKKSEYFAFFKDYLPHAGKMFVDEVLRFEGCFSDFGPSRGKIFYEDLDNVVSFKGVLSNEGPLVKGVLIPDKGDFSDGREFDRDGKLRYEGTYYGNNQMYNGTAYSPSGEEICTYKNGVKVLTKEAQKRIDLKADIEADIVAKELLNEEQAPTKKKKEKKSKSSHQPFIEKTDDPKYLINQLEFGANQNEDDLNSVSNVTRLTNLTKATQYTQRPLAERFEGADQNQKKQVLNELSTKLERKITKKDIKTLEFSEMIALNKILSLAIARKEGLEIPKHGIKFKTPIGHQCEGYLNKLGAFFEHIDTPKPFDKSKGLKEIKDTIYDISESGQLLNYKFEKILEVIKKHFEVNNNRLASKIPLKIIGGGKKLTADELKKEVIAHDIVVVKKIKGPNYNIYYSNALKIINEFHIEEVEEDEKEIFNLKKLVSSTNVGEYNAETLATTSFNKAVSILSCDMESRIKAAITDYLTHIQIKHEQETTTAAACFDSLITLMQPCFFSKNLIPRDKHEEEQRIVKEIKKISDSDASIQSMKEDILDCLQGAVDSATKQKISRKLNKYIRQINKEKEKRELQLSNTLGDKVDELIFSTTDKLAPKETINSNEEETFNQLRAFQKEIKKYNTLPNTNEKNTKEITIPISELEYQDNEILELLDCYLQENAITYYQPKRISINSFHIIQEIGYAIKFFYRSKEAITEFSNKIKDSSIKNKNELFKKIEEYVNTIHNISVENKKLQDQIKSFFSGIDYTNIESIKARFVSFMDYLDYNDNLNDLGQLSSFELKKSRNINEKIFTKNGVIFVAINPGPIGLIIDGQSFSDFDDKLKNALWELNSYLEENPSQKNSRIEFLFPLNINNNHWVLGRGTINKGNQLVFKLHDPFGNGKNIQDYPEFKDKINNGALAYKSAVDNAGRYNNLMSVVVEFDSSNHQHKDVQRGLYCGGAVLRMMLGIVLNNGGAYNWTGLDKNGRSEIDTNYLSSKQARLNDLVILKTFIGKDSEKKIIYTQLLERYGLNNNLIDQKTTEFENAQEYTKDFLIQFCEINTYQIADIVDSYEKGNEKDILIKYWKTRIQDQYYSLLPLKDIIWNKTGEISGLEDLIIQEIFQRITVDFSSESDGIKIAKAEKDALKLINLLSNSSLNETEILIETRKSLLELISTRNLIKK
jgi:hypothetical protein